MVVRRGAVHCVGKQAAPTHRKRPTKPSAVTCRKTRQIRGFALSCAATLPPMKHPFGSHLSASMCQSGWGLKYKRAAACFTWLHKRPNGVGVDPQKRCFFGTQALKGDANAKRIAKVVAQGSVKAFKLTSKAVNDVIGDLGALKNPESIGPLLQAVRAATATASLGGSRRGICPGCPPWRRTRRGLGPRRAAAARAR